MGDVAEQIVEYTAEIEADIIIMGTHGYKGLEKIMFGSVADKVVRSALCPVTTINPYTCCTWEFESGSDAERRGQHFYRLIAPQQDRSSSSILRLNHGPGHYVVKISCCCARYFMNE